MEIIDELTSDHWPILLTLMWNQSRFSKMYSISHTKWHKLKMNPSCIKANRVESIQLKRKMCSNLQYRESKNRSSTEYGITQQQLK